MTLTLASKHRNDFKVISINGKKVFELSFVGNPGETALNSINDGITKKGWTSTVRPTDCEVTVWEISIPDGETSKETVKDMNIILDQAFWVKRG